MASSPSSAAREYLPGYRFCPTDVVLIKEYLDKKCRNLPVPGDSIRDVDLYAYHPADLIDLYRTGTEVVKEWYFFTTRNRKYLNGSRTSRTVGNIGFWKVTGKGKPVKDGSRIIGKKKVLVYMDGNAKNPRKTDWIMHEYRTVPEFQIENNINHGMKFDQWVLCRIKLNGPKERCVLNTTGPIRDEAVDQRLSMVVSSDGFNEQIQFDQIHSRGHLYTDSLNPPEIGTSSWTYFRNFSSKSMNQNMGTNQFNSELMLDCLDPFIKNAPYEGSSNFFPETQISPILPSILETGTQLPLILQTPQTYSCLYDTQLPVLSTLGPPFQSHLASSGLSSSEEDLLPFSSKRQRMN